MDHTFNLNAFPTIRLYKGNKFVEYHQAADGHDLDLQSFEKFLETNGIKIP